MWLKLGPESTDIFCLRSMDDVLTFCTGGMTIINYVLTTYYSLSMMKSIPNDEPSR